MHGEAVTYSVAPSLLLELRASLVMALASPCIECAKLIIQAGIKRVIYGEQYRLTDGIDLLKRANIEVKYLNPDDYEHKEV